MPPWAKVEKLALLIVSIELPSERRRDLAAMLDNSTFSTNAWRV
jgi:hypothetical protein